MDIDWYLSRNQPTWDRLGDLTRRARRRVGDLSPDELDELLSLYQRVSAQLSFARTEFHDVALTARLTRLVADASGVIYGKRARSRRVVRDFFAVSFPAAVWHYRRFILLGAALLLVPAIAMGTWLLHDARALDASGTKEQRQEYVHDEFEQYYSSSPHPVFFTRVFFNNVLVSFEAFGGGAALGAFGLLAMVANGLAVGRAAAWMISEGSGARFFGLILPHGMLEISAICIAGGTGLKLGWTLINPGDRLRGQAMAEEGRRLVVIILGIVFMFLGAAIIEGFITGSGWSPWLRIGIGATGWLLVVTYFVTFGRAAAAQGFTGDLGEVQRAADRETARGIDLAVDA